MKNILLVLTAFLFLAPYKMVAENTIVSIEGIWNIEDERSILFTPQLSIDEQNIYIYSEKELNNLEVTIKDSLGNILYYNVVTISGCAAYSIDITNLGKGDYTIQIKKGSNYIKGIIHIDNSFPIK